MWCHIVAPALLTDGDWKRLLGCIALLQGCDGHLITWLTEVIRHLHPTGASARHWPPLPPRAPTISQIRFMHIAITHISCYHYHIFTCFMFLPYTFLSPTHTVYWKNKIWLTPFSVMKCICKRHYLSHFPWLNLSTNWWTFCISSYLFCLCKVPFRNIS